MERELKRSVLCPVALDDTWKDCDWDPVLRKQIERYAILDFSDWQDEEVFARKVKEKLLDGLALFYKRSGR